ncbi:MAG: hypothetical protein AAGI38_18445 [Bacteroidota bacterium]
MQDTEYIESLVKLRELYKEAVGSPSSARKLWKKPLPFDPDHPMITPYRACARALMALHSWNPFEKLQFLNESMSLFQQAVTQQPRNPEIRFLRFSIQHNMPAFLLSNGDYKAEDKQVFLDEFEHYPDYYLEDYAPEMVDFFEKSKYCTPDEIEHLHQALALHS